MRIADELTEALLEESSSFRSKLKPSDMVSKMGRRWFVTHNADGSKVRQAGLDFSSKRAAMEQAENMVVVWHARNGHPLPPSLSKYRKTYDRWASHEKEHGSKAQEKRRVATAEKDARRLMRDAHDIVKRFGGDDPQGKRIVKKQLDMMIRRAKAGLHPVYVQSYGKEYESVWKKTVRDLERLKKKESR